VPGVSPSIETSANPFTRILNQASVALLASLGTRVIVRAVADAVSTGRGDLVAAGFGSAGAGGAVGAGFGSAGAGGVVGVGFGSAGDVLGVGFRSVGAGAGGAVVVEGFGSTGVALAGGVDSANAGGIRAFDSAGAGGPGLESFESVEAGRCDSSAVAVRSSTWSPTAATRGVFVSRPLSISLVETKTPVPPVAAPTMNIASVIIIARRLVRRVADCAAPDQRVGAGPFDCENVLAVGPVAT
jgi:hypothetical protein